VVLQPPQLHTEATDSTAPGTQVLAVVQLVAVSTTITNDTVPSAAQPTTPASMTTTTLDEHQEVHNTSTTTYATTDQQASMAPTQTSNLSEKKSVTFEITTQPPPTSDHFVTTQVACTP